MLQALEARRLLSAAVQFDNASGLLSVIGTDKPDRIEVAVGSSPLCTLDGLAEGTGRAKLRAAQGNYVNVFVEDRLVLQTFFRGTSLREISVIGGGGDDRLMSCNFESSVPAYVWGEGGDDAIDAVVFGAVRGTGLFAGDGNDVVRAGGYPKAGFLVWGEGGDDTITGSIAADTLYGDDNDPREWIRPSGNDVLYGGDGDDFLCGCDGSDALYGQAGNDFLDGEGGADMLDGGAGEDFGVYDPLDKMIDIELMMK